MLAFFLFSYINRFEFSSQNVASCEDASQKFIFIVFETVLKFLNSPVY